MWSEIYNWIKSWRKTIWWVILLIIFSFYTWLNKNRIFSQNPLPVDYCIVILLLLLLLFPLAAEIDFLGFSIKKEVESLKTEIKGELVNLRSEVHNSATIQAYFQNSPQPSSDDKLREMEIRYSKLFEQISPSSEKEHEIDPLDNLDIPKKVQNLIRVRLKLEQELSRIYRDRFRDSQKQFTNVIASTRLLTREGLIDSRLANLIVEIKLICNSAIHGGTVSDEQYEFVKRFFPMVIITLKEI